MNNTKKLTILHSNDLHGDFNAEQVDSQLVGGVSRLSGYISKVRLEEENVLYAISGDMFRGSLIDSEFRGISTIEIMNMLAPDVATLGNHEIDYGIAHLLFLEKCAKFPIINANLFIKKSQTRLFRSHIILEQNGIKILFIGILTEEVLTQAKKDAYVGALVDVHEAAKEVGKTCDSYRTEDIDLTVLLTHIGLDADKKLASILNPDWGVDIIIGGHSHTHMTEPVIAAGIPIVQAACGTDQIGRFDLIVDTESNSIRDFTWELIPIDSKCPRDIDLEKVLNRYQDATDEKYRRYITRFADVYTHPRRDRETLLGKLFSDILRESLGLDVMLLGSGSLRKASLGPVVEYRDLVEMFPYDETVIRVTFTGEQLKKALYHIFRPETLCIDSHGESYQFSSGLRFVLDMKSKKLSDISFQGKPIPDGDLFSVGLQDFHFKNIEEFLGISEETVRLNKPTRVIATSSIAVIEEWLSQNKLVTAPSDQRWITLE